MKNILKKENDTMDDNTKHQLLGLLALLIGLVWMIHMFIVTFVK